MFHALAWETLNNRRSHDDINLHANDGRARTDSHSRTNQGQTPGGPYSVLSPRPTQARAHRRLSPLAPALLVRVFKFETCGFSRPSRPPTTRRREGAGPRANQPSLGGSRPAPGMWPRPARTCRPGLRQPRPARLPVAGVGQVAAPGVQAARPYGELVLRAQSRCPAQTGREEAGWAGRTRFPGAGPGRGRGRGGRGGAGPMLMAPCQLH